VNTSLLFGRTHVESMDTLQDQVEKTFSFRFSPVFTFFLFRRHTLSMDITSDRVKDPNGDEHTTYRYGVNHSIFVSDVATVGYSISFLSTNELQKGKNLMSYTLNFSYRALDKRLPVNFSIFYLPNKENRKVKTVLRLRYDIHKKGSLKYAWKFSKYSGNTRKFWENTISLSYTVRF